MSYQGFINLSRVLRKNKQIMKDLDIKHLKKFIKIPDESVELIEENHLETCNSEEIDEGVKG